MSSSKVRPVSKTDARSSRDNADQIRSWRRLVWRNPIAIFIVLTLLTILMALALRGLITGSMRL